MTQEEHATRGGGSQTLSYWKSNPALNVAFLRLTNVFQLQHYVCAFLLAAAGVLPGALQYCNVLWCSTLMSKSVRMICYNVASTLGVAATTAPMKCYNVAFVSMIAATVPVMCNTSNVVPSWTCLDMRAAWNERKARDGAVPSRRFRSF